MLQQALQFQLPSSTSTPLEGGTILPLQQRAVAPADHDDVREAVVTALTGATPACPVQLSPLLLDSLATLLPSRLPAGLRASRLLWRAIVRLCAGGLSGLELRCPASTSGTDLRALIAWHSEEEFYHLPLQQDEVVAELLGLANEILDSRDTAGRLYALLHPGLSAEDDRLLVGYFTEGEALALESAGLGLALV
jgi:hypothetical protein